MSNSPQQSEAELKAWRAVEGVCLLRPTIIQHTNQSGLIMLHFNGFVIPSIIHIVLQDLISALFNFNLALLTVSHSNVNLTYMWKHESDRGQ